MASSREPSHPPSDPQPSVLRAGRIGSLFAAEERPLRTQLAAAMLVGLVLVAAGLWLWRRPPPPPETAAPDPVAAVAASAMAVAGDAAAPTAGGVTAASAPVALSDARVLVCQDRGRGHTPPDQCDHLGAIEQALGAAITQAAACVPPASGGGTIEYVADVSFSHHKVGLALPRAGRSVRDRKVLRACSAAVRGAFAGVPLDGVDHQHARYKIAVTATYRGSASGG